MRILGIDPGAFTGWAVFDDFELTSCGLYDWHRPEKHGPMPSPTGISQVYSERPKHYPHSKVPFGDLITLSLRAGECMGRYRDAGAQCHYFEPWEWKGSLDKDSHQPRLWDALSAKEKDVVDRSCRGVAPGKRNNVMDAIGLGLFGVGRVTNYGAATNTRRLYLALPEAPEPVAA